MEAITPSTTMPAFAWEWSAMPEPPKVPPTDGGYDVEDADVPPATPAKHVDTDESALFN